MARHLGGAPPAMERPLRLSGPSGDETNGEREETDFAAEKEEGVKALVVSKKWGRWTSKVSS